MAKKRNARHEAIREIVRSKRVKTQRELVDALKDRGFSCTQATISRDIGEMGLHKLPEGIYVLADDLHLQRMVGDLVVSVRRSQQLVLIGTAPGSANAVTTAIDAAELPGVLGSIAGDDTILVVCDGEEAAKTFAESINRLRPEE